VIVRHGDPGPRSPLVLALAIGTIVRRRLTATVATVIVVIVLPYFFAEASVLPLSAGKLGCCGSCRPGRTASPGMKVYPAIPPGHDALTRPSRGVLPLLPRGPAWRCSPRDGGPALALAAYLLRRRDA